MKNIFKCIFFMVSIRLQIQSANILGISPLASTSHFNVIRPVYLELAKRGHNITVISALREDNYPSNYHHVQVDRISPEQIFSKSKDDDADLFKILSEGSLVSMFFMLWGGISDLTNKTLHSKPVQDFIKNDNTKFDLVLCEEFNLVPYYMFAHKYKAPLVTFMSFSGSHYVNDYMGNPMNLQYNPNEFLTTNEKFSLWNRVQNTVITMIYQVIRMQYFFPSYNKIAREHFNHLPGPLPDVREIEKNISLVFANTHFSMDIVRSYLPNMIEFGGVHVEPLQPLPEDLQYIMDNAKNGVVYFSLGSNFKSKHMGLEKRKVFLEVFSKMKQVILWKWEDEQLPEKPDNVIIRKWFPQSDILGHPNLRMFITHGGLLSTIESIYRGVPIVGIPIAADQPSNMAKAKSMGFAELVRFDSLSVTLLRDVIDRLLHDPKYRINARELSIRVNDKPMSAMETTIFWIEYVIRHKGAYHMKTPSSWMTWYQYYLLDVIIVCSLTAMVIISIFVWLLKCVIKKITGKNTTTKVIRDKKISENLVRAKHFGYGEEIIFCTLTAESVSEAIDKVLKDVS